MSAVENKSLLKRLFAETAKGNGRPFVNALADDVRWTIIGTTDWSRTYEGKDAVVNELLGPLAAQFEGPNFVSAEHLVAEGDVVVVQARNHSVTKAGAAYPNRYCWVIGMQGDKMREITEYTDTQLIATVLSGPHAG